MPYRPFLYAGSSDLVKGYLIRWIRTHNGSGLLRARTLRSAPIWGLLPPGPLTNSSIKAIPSEISSGLPILQGHTWRRWSRVLCTTPNFTWLAIIQARRLPFYHLSTSSTSLYHGFEVPFLALFSQSFDFDVRSTIERSWLALASVFFLSSSETSVESASAAV